MTPTCRSPISAARTARASRPDHLVAVVVLLALTAALVLGGMRPAVAGTQTDAALAERRQIIHLLNRIGYGPRPGDIERVQRMGLKTYIDRQLHPETIDDTATEARLASLASLHMTTLEIAEKYPDRNAVAQALGLSLQAETKPETGPAPSDGPPPPARADNPDPERQLQDMRRQILAYYAEHGLHPPQKLLEELQAQKLIRAVYSERQLLEVMVDFWFNHFNVFWGKGADRWLTTDFEMHTIRPHALGTFKDLLVATAKSPAMLFYLDNFLSSSPDATRPDGAGQNPMARAGDVGQAQMGGDQPRPARANELRQRPRGINENYARELMELHTMGVDGGYTQQDVQEVARCFTGWTIEQPRRGARFVFRSRMHDDGEKVVLGHKIPAGGGIEDGERVLDILAHHPSTARFIATKLVRRFVSDDPPPALVDRVAAVYATTDGDIRAMLRTILTSAEFAAPAAYRAKIKSPLELAASAIRALDGNTDGSPRLAQVVAKMGQPLYQYMPPTGFPDRAAQWVTAGALLERLNFGLALSANRLPGTSVDLAHLMTGIDPTEGDRLLARAIDVLLHGDVSPSTRAVLARQVREDPRPENVVGLVLGSPEFQRR
jgi:uncharacterized protein (DUF1800 family)